MTKELRIPHCVHTIRWGALILLAAACLTFGLWRGEAAVVLQKGIRVCLECIGIG